MTTAACRGFVYATAVMGVTGARASTSDLAGPLVARTERATDLPVGVGLGVSNGAQAAEVASYADGVIVGSAFVRVPARPRRPARALEGADRAHRGPRRGGYAVRRRPRPRSLLASPWRSSGCAQEPGRATFTGAVLHQQYHAPDTMLTDTDGQPFSLASSTDKRLTLVFFGYTHCPDECPTTMATLASAMLQLDDGRPRQRAGGLRDHRPRPRHRPGHPALARPLRPVVRRRHRAAAEDQARRRDAGRPGRAGPAAAQRRVRRHPRHPGPRARRRRTPCPSSGPSAPPRPSSPTTSTSCSPEDRRARRLFIPSPAEGVWYLGPLPAARLRAVHHRAGSWPRSGSANGAGWPAAAPTARSRTSPCGRCRSAWSAAGSTT